MELTSAAFVWTTAILAVLAFATGVWLLPKLVGSWFRVLSRVVVLAMVNVLVILSAVAYLNSSNGWYSSWDDLLGVAPKTVASADGNAAKAASAGSKVTDAPIDKPLPPLPSPGQRKQVYTYTGKTTGLTGRIEVILPKSYEDPASATRRYPVAEAFHGFPGTPSGWTSKMDVMTRFDTAIAAGKMSEVIVVAPTISIPGNVDSECVNGPPGKAQMETWVSEDVPRFIRDHFRVKSGRDSWVAMGYSVGGYCATMMGIHHHKTFGAIVALGGYVKPDFANGSQPWPNGSPLAARYDLVAHMKKSPPAVAMYLQVGKQSPFWKDINAFLTATKEPTALTQVIVLDGGHRWDIWQNEMPKVAAWLGSSIPGFKPEGANKPKS